MHHGGPRLHRQLERLQRAELLHRNNRRPDPQRRNQGAQSEDVEHRDGDQRHVVPGHPQRFRQSSIRPHQVGVRQHHALGFPGGARRIEDRVYVLLRVDGYLGTGLPLTRRHQIFELEDTVVVPQVLFTHSHHVLEAGEVELHPLKQLQVVQPVELLHHDYHRRLGVSQHELELMRRIGGV